MRVKYSLLLLCLAAGFATAQSKDIAITGVKIETGDGRVIPSGTVVIRDGKILAVGESVTAPEGAEIIDGAGKTLYPGFIDGYSTRGLKLPDAPAAGTPPDTQTNAPATMWNGNRKGIRLDVVAAKCLDLKGQLTSNYEQGITTALIAPGGGSIRGIASVVNYSEPGGVLVPNAAAEIAIRGGGFGGGGGGQSGYPGSLLGIVSLARQILIDAQQYAADGNAKKDEGFDNLKPLMAGQIPALFSADNEREIFRCGQLANEFGLRPVYAGARDAYLLIDLLKSKNAAVIASIDVGEAPSTKPSESPDATPVAVLEERHETWMERSRNVKKLLDAGIPVCFSSSGGNLSDFLKNARRQITFGVPRETVLKCLTSGAATILGVADRAGTIAEGKQANLVLMSGDFAEDKSEVLSVFVEGKKVDVKKGADK